MEVLTPGTQWPDPMPLGDEVDPPDFPTERLPLWLGHFIRAQAEASQVPEDLPGMLGLAALSAAVQGKINVLANNATWTEPVCCTLPSPWRRGSVNRLSSPI